MMFHLKIEPGCQETVTACVHRRTALVDEIERLVLQDGLPDQLPGYEEDAITLLELRQVECFYVQADRTYASYAGGRQYLIKKRLYELEEILPAEFEKINKSAIANWKKIRKFKVQLSGAVDVVFQSGYTDCVSRRCFAELKRRYKL